MRKSGKITYNGSMALKRNVKKGQVILYKGEASNSIYIVSEGLVRAYNILDSGEERTVALFGPGEYFPVGVAFKNTPVALFYYETLLNSELEIYGLDEFDKIMQNSGYEDAKKLASQYVAMMLHVAALGHKSARNKVANMLQFLSLRYGESLTGQTFMRISIPLTQDDIARMSGLSRETVTVELGKLKSEGVIDVKKKQYLIHTKKLLKAIDENDPLDITL